MINDLGNLSRAVSHALRHEPWYPAVCSRKHDSTRYSLSWQQARDARLL